MTKGKKVALPRWESRDEADQNAMEEWVNQQLDRELWKRAEGVTNPQSIADLATHLERPEVRLASAIATKDRDRVLEIIEDPAMRRELVDGMFRPHGRPTGQHERTAASLAMAKSEIELVRAIWEKHYKKSTRDKNNQPFANEIVWRRFQDMGIKLNKKALGIPVGTSKTK